MLLDPPSLNEIRIHLFISIQLCCWGGGGGPCDPRDPPPPAPGSGHQLQPHAHAMLLQQPP